MKYDVIIGCEVHVQLLTESKAFCRCANTFGGEPNTRVCPVCMGLPGSLPVTNGAMIDAAIAHEIGGHLAPPTSDEPIRTAQPRASSRKTRPPDRSLRRRGTPGAPNRAPLNLAKRCF